MGQPPDERSEDLDFGRRDASIYDVEVDPGGGTSQALLLAKVPPGSSVLELGAATGPMTRLLAERGCEVTAVELDADAAARAGASSVRVIVGDLETMDLAAEVEGQRFDVVVAADVLEHLRDPGALLARLRDLVNPRGHVLASIPNVAHASVRLALLGGGFPYFDYGLLDRTHLRFFTLDTVEALFDEAGYRITEVDRVVRERHKWEVAHDPDQLPPKILDWVMRQPEATTYQFIVSAEPLPAPLTVATQHPAPTATAPWELLAAQSRWLRELQESVDEMRARDLRAKLARKARSGLRRARAEVIPRLRARRPAPASGPLDAESAPARLGSGALKLGVGGDQQVRCVAFYLPQFHPTPENDEWWGQGFTEWTTVTRSRPRFRGHYQPHLPADLGFYDLRLPEVRQHQADLARQYGIDAFCYYHYWFSGRRLLDRPFREVLASGEPDFPFLLCWANETWTRVWSDRKSEYVMHQLYSAADDLAHIRALLPVFADPRYLRVDGKPVFVVYRAGNLPDARRTTDLWRNEASRLGVGELYLCRVEFVKDRGDPKALGFDANIEFQPDWLNLPAFQRQSWLAREIRTYLGPNRRFRHDRIYDYERMVEEALARPDPGYKRFRCVTPGWDNSARRRSAPNIFVGSTPARYGAWLEETIARFQPYSPEENLVFVDAWNEWAEGCHLEPDQRWGRQYLEAHRDGRSQGLARRWEAEASVLSQGEP